MSACTVSRVYVPQALKVGRRWKNWIWKEIWYAIKNTTEIRTKIENKKYVNIHTRTECKRSLHIHAGGHVCIYCKSLNIFRVVTSKCSYTRYSWYWVKVFQWNHYGYKKVNAILELQIEVTSSTNTQKLNHWFLIDN